MTAAASRAARALLAFAREALGGTSRWPLDRPLDEGDWPGVLGLARRESLTPLLHGAYAGVLAAHGAPPGHLAALARDYRESVGRAVLHAQALGQVLDSSERAGIELLVLKGMALGEALYGDPALRPMSDLDLLVRGDDVAGATRLLARLGYRPLSNVDDDVRHRGATAFVSDAPVSSRPVIDLHWTLVERWYGARPGAWPTDVWTRAQPLTIAGRTARVLAPADALFHACVHLAGNHGLRGVLWYCDIHRMARCWAPDLGWHDVVERATRAGLAGPVWAALRCVDAALGLDTPSSVLTALQPAAWRTRMFLRWLTPRLLALRSLPYHDYVVPLFLIERRRDLAAVVLGRAGRALAGSLMAAAP